jgi:hypothetical protein
MTILAALVTIAVVGGLVLRELARLGALDESTERWIRVSALVPALLVVFVLVAGIRLVQLS